MKRFLVCAALSAVMFFMVSCGGSDSKSESNENNDYHCEDGDSYFNTGNDFWELYEKCENGCDTSTGKCKPKDNSRCKKITPKWNETNYDYEYDEDDETLASGELSLGGTYSPKTGTNPDYGDEIWFVMEYSGQPKNEYDFASTANAGVYVYEGLRETTEEEYEETGREQAWDRAYIAVSGKVKINSLDVINEHASVSFQNVRLQEATINRDNEDAQWTMVEDGACLVIESASFEQ